MAQEPAFPEPSLIAAARAPFAIVGLSGCGRLPDIHFERPPTCLRRLRGPMLTGWLSMQFFARLALLFVFAFGLPLAAVAKDFSHTGVAADAKRYETFLKSNWKATDALKKPADLKVDAEKIFGTDARAASRLLANVVAADDKDSAS